MFTGSGKTKEKGNQTKMKQTKEDQKFSQFLHSVDEAGIYFEAQYQAQLNQFTTKYCPDGFWIITGGSLTETFRPDGTTNEALVRREANLIAVISDTIYNLRISYDGTLPYCGRWK